MARLLHPHSPLRIFAVSSIITIAGLLAALIGLGPAALLTTAILIVIEVIFSFDNAIVNAKILGRLSPVWQTAFLTIGIVVAIFGMRLLFPLVIVALAAHLGLADVWQLALNKPHEYADKLQLAHPLIASFGGAFLLLLALEFFLNGEHKALWWQGLERRLKRLRSFWLPTAIAVIIVLIVAGVNHAHGGQILRAGLLGVAVYVAVQLLTWLLGKGQPKSRSHSASSAKSLGPRFFSNFLPKSVSTRYAFKQKITKNSSSANDLPLNKQGGSGSRKQLTGWAALSLFIYLQILDASFSFDGVIGAFAITDVVVLIALGLGIGALWVRSMTVFMVRRGTLEQYIYLEHGAYYTILVLAAALFISLFVEVPDVITGIIGLGIIVGALVASVQVARRKVPTGV